MTALLTLDKDTKILEGVSIRNELFTVTKGRWLWALTEQQQVLEPG